MKTTRRLLERLSGRTTDPKAITRESVRWAYRLFLDREPEDERALTHVLRACSNTTELRRYFILEDEFKQKNPPLHSPVLSGDEPAMAIEEAGSAQDLQRLLDHIRQSWQALGEREPHWSVLTSDQFLQANIQNNETAFYDSGKQNVVQLLGHLERNRVDLSRFHTCLEYGCGVGRVTRWLAERFEQVFAVDVSRAHLHSAQEYLKTRNITNVTCSQINRIQDIQHLPQADLIYSLIVLQHNPPPVIRLIIEGFIHALNAGGIAFFQVPTYRLGYRFSLEQYFNAEATRLEMEMHIFPQSQVFEIARAMGAHVIEVIDDGWTGLRYKEVSNTFVIQKAA